jgi:predicted O-methyltransferase YrrM
MPATADALLALARSYWECRPLLTAAELDVFTQLARQPLTAAEAAQRLKGNERGVATLLDALVGMELLTKHDGRYRCEPDVAALLSADGPQSVLPMVRHSASLWSSWSELTGIVRGDPAAWDRANAPRDESHRAAFIGAMHVVAGPAARGLMGAIRPQGSHNLLDVGGASGTFTIAFLEGVPGARATLFDLPPVIELARPRLREAGVADRVTLAAGDFYVDPLPGGHDLVLLSAIIHQNGPAQNVALYRKCCDALVPGGRLVIRDHVMSADHTQPPRGALFAINMLMRTDAGGTYTFDEIRRDLEAAGFTRVALVQPDSGKMDGLVEAYRP